MHLDQGLLLLVWYRSLMISFNLCHGKNVIIGFPRYILMLFVQANGKIQIER